jgi:phosphatidate cytidylyltransferase
LLLDLKVDFQVYIMKQRIVTGLILIVLATLWLMSSPVGLFLLGLVFIIFIGAFEYSQFFIKNRVNDESFLSSPKEYMESNSTGDLLKRLAYALFVVLACLLSHSLINDFSGLDSVFLEDRNIHLLFGKNGYTVLQLIFVCSALWWLLAAFLVFTYPRSSALAGSAVFKSAGGFFYFVPFFLATYILRCQSFSTDPNIGTISILSVMVLVWAADSGAYFVGKACGKHKMSPHVSPNKTFEGLAGGVVLSLVIFAVLACLGCYGNAFQVCWPALAVAAVVTVIFSVIGDLWESLLKRDSGIKDSGFIFPGHGGMLDRIDSLMAALPVFLITFAVMFKILG